MAHATLAAQVGQARNTIGCGVYAECALLVVQYGPDRSRRPPGRDVAVVRDPAHAAGRHLFSGNAGGYKLSDAGKGARGTMVDLSRREMLKRVVVAGAAAALPGARGTGASAQAPVPAAGFEVLTTDEGAALRAVVARLIPADERGPGALEAGAATYIDRALAGPLAASREAYRAGLAALDAAARSAQGTRFAALAAADQDALLRDVEAGAAPAFGSGAAGFFNLVLAHTRQGTFSDPAHGGNVDFIGWRMLGYPGVRTAVPPDLQRIDRLPPERHVSAYDYPAFNAARERRTRGR